MMFDIEKVSFKSSNEINTVFGQIFVPKEINIRGIIQICHGMCEYIDNYEVFIKYFLEKGFIVCGHDHIGHGDSVNSLDDLGYFAEKDGYKFLIEDTKKFTYLVKEKYSGYKLYLFGHSMGSFIARCYAAKYGNELAGVILCGTIGPQLLINTGISLAKLMEDSKGKKYRSKKLYDLALDFANLKFLPARTRYDWITSNEAEIDRYIKDEKNNFLFTVSGFKDLFHLVSVCSLKNVIKTVPKDLPILFVSGEFDPIGENTVGVKRAFKLYKDENIKDIELKIYKGCRHALFHEPNREEIFNDIYKWIDNRESK